MRLQLQSRAARWIGLAALGTAAIVSFGVIRASRLATAYAQQAAPPIATATKQVSDVVAVVNGERISRMELAQECTRRYGKETLEGTINRQLIQQACDQHKITVTPQEVDGEINRLAERFKLEPGRWLQLLEQERGFTAEEYRREVIWPMLAMRKLTAAEIQVKPEEVDQAFESEYGPRVRVRIINSTQQQKAVELRAQAIAKPADFANLAEKSDDPGIASAQGVVPPIRRYVGDKKFEDVVFKLKEGEISQVIQVANEYYVVKCEGILAATFIAPKDMKPVKDRLVERIKEQKLRSVAGDMFKTLQTKANVVVVYGKPEEEKKYPGVAAYVNKKPITMQELGEECIARHGRDTLEGEVNRRLLLQELSRMHQTVTPQDLEAEVARAAEMYGFVKKDGTPDPDRWIKEVTSHDGATRDLYIRDAVWPSVALKKVIPKVEVTEEDLRKGFEANYGEMVEVLAIVMQDGRQAQKVWEMARNNQTDVYFGQLAETYSVEPVSRANNGKVPPIRKYSGQGKIEEEAFKLQPGEMSAIVETSNQQIILRCVGRKQPEKISFADARSELQKDLMEQKLRVEMTKKFDALKEGAQIDNFVSGTSKMPKKGILSQGVPGAVPGATTSGSAPVPNGAATSAAPRNVPAGAGPTAQPVRK